MIGRVHDDRQPDLPHVGKASRLLSLGFGPGEGGQQHSRQDRYDGDHDQQFDQSKSESAPGRFHKPIRKPLRTSCKASSHAAGQRLLAGSGAALRMIWMNGKLRLWKGGLLSACRWQSRFACALNKLAGPVCGRWSASGRLVMSFLARARQRPRFLRIQRWETSPHAAGAGCSCRNTCPRPLAAQEFWTSKQ